MMGRRIVEEDECEWALVGLKGWLDIVACIHADCPMSVSHAARCVV